MLAVRIENAEYAQLTLNQEVEIRSTRTLEFRHGIFFNNRGRWMITEIRGFAVYRFSRFLGIADTIGKGGGSKCRGSWPCHGWDHARETQIDAVA